MRPKIYALGNSGHPSIVATLEKYAQHSDVLIQRTAVSALRSVPPEHSLISARRIGVSKKHHRITRRMACEHLAKHGDVRADACFATIRAEAALAKLKAQTTTHPVLAALLQTDTQ